MVKLWKLEKLDNLMKYINSHFPMLPSSSIHPMAGWQINVSSVSGVSGVSRISMQTVWHEEKANQYLLALSMYEIFIFLILVFGTSVIIYSKAAAKYSCIEISSSLEGLTRRIM